MKNIPRSLSISRVGFIRRFSALIDIFGCVHFIFQAGTITASFLMLIFNDSAIVLWIGTSTFGLFMSNVFPSSVALVEQYFDVTGKDGSEHSKMSAILNCILTSRSIAEITSEIYFKVQFTF